jgi:transcriptional regulator with XRE-family HTH domain
MAFTSGVVMQNQHDRLGAALRGKGMSQKQFAESLKISQPLVSMWLKGDRWPDRETLARAARLLDADPEWIVSGKGREPAGARRRSLARAFERLRWVPRPGPVDGGRDGGNANQFAIRPSFRNLVRELIQNVLDERLSPLKPAIVRFRLLSLRGEAKARFLDALRLNELRPHLEACATVSDDEQAAGGFDQALDVADSGELLVLQIIDSGTRGLTGPEHRDGNFAGLTRDNLFSHKNKPGAAGSYGLGKAMQYAASMFGCVLFNSELSEPEPDTGNVSGRFFARAELVWHEVEDEDGEPHAFSGPAWLGDVVETDEGDVPVSHWIEAGGESFVNDLHMARPAGGPGTTIAIVGLRDLDSDRPRPPREVIEQIAREAEENFWPAIEAGELEVRVEYVEIDDPGATPEPEIDTLVTPARSRVTGPLVEALRAHSDDAIVEMLIDEGDVVAGVAELAVPARSSGAEGERHKPFAHEAIVLLRRARAEELLEDDGEPSGTIRRASLMRGANMVVKSLDLTKGAVGAQPFHVVVLAGRAAGDSDEDLRAEEFLRRAEPPSHDDWTTTPRLKRLYSPPYTKALNDFNTAIRRTVRDLLAIESSAEPDGPGDLSRRFRFGEPSPPERAPRVLIHERSVGEDGAWHIEGSIRLRGDLQRVVAGRPQISFLGESGGRARVKWRSLELVGPSKARVREGDHTIVIPPNTRTTKFTGVTNPESHPAPADETVAVMTFTPTRKDS